MAKKTRWERWAPRLESLCVIMSGAMIPLVAVAPWTAILLCSLGWMGAYTISNIESARIGLETVDLAQELLVENAHLRQALLAVEVPELEATLDEFPTN